MNIRKPLVSIITPSFNQCQFIEDTILSVINQTYSNIQYILVDGGSTDDTMKIVEKYRDKIDIIFHEKDKGQSDAINKGFRVAKGELVGWINSDDILNPECVERIVGLYLAYPNGSIYYGAKLNFIKENNDFIRMISLIVPNKKILLSHNYDIIQPGSFYKNEMIKKLNYLNEELHFSMDLDLWLRLLDMGPIYYDNTLPLANFRFWEDSKTCSCQKVFFREIRQTLRRHGAHRFDKTIMRLNYYLFKELIKQALNIRNKRH